MSETQGWIGSDGRGTQHRRIGNCQITVVLTEMEFKGMEVWGWSCCELAGRGTIVSGRYPDKDEAKRIAEWVANQVNGWDYGENADG